MSEKIITIARYSDYMEAELAKQMLEDNGIEAVVGGANTANAYSFLPFAVCELQVFESKAKDAMEILVSMKYNPAENIEMPEDTECDLDDGKESN